MSVAGRLAEMPDEGLRLLEQVAAADPEASAEVLARLHVHLLRARRRLAEVAASSQSCADAL